MASILLAAALAAPIMAGAVTNGGAVPGGMVVHVASLADSGPGTLRAALQVQGPKVIVFDVGGMIALASDLKLATPQTTIAGQSAPPPGITLAGGSLRLRASDIVVQHIAVRPGPGATPAVNGNRDGVTIGGGAHPIQNIRVENVSISWPVDEGIDIAGGTRNVTVRDCIIAEALRNAGHPKGRHSMGMLVNKDNQGVAITGNLFAANMFRNPVIARGGSAFVGYNMIADPAENAVHFYDAPAPTPLQASVIGNLVEPGPDTARNVTAVQIPDDMAQKLSGAAIYLDANRAPAGPLTNRGGFALAATPPVVVQDAPPADTRAEVLKHAGARPAARDAVDARIVAGVSAHTLRVIDSPAASPPMPPSQAAAGIPPTPFGPSERSGMTRISAWLCQRHFELGGAATAECPRADYPALLRARLSQGR